jgi:hypothetical protein
MLHNKERQIYCGEQLDRPITDFQMIDRFIYLTQHRKNYANR